MKLDLIVLASIVGLLIAFMPGIQTFLRQVRIHEFLGIFAIILSAARIIKVLLSGFISPALSNGAAVVIEYGTLLWFCLSVLLITYHTRLTQSKIHDNYNHLLSLSLGGATIFNAGLFVFYTIGKLRHNEEIIKFFVDSGYPGYFNYLTISLECITSLILLAYPNLKVKLICAFIMMAEMLGAVITHLNNNDPFDNSYDAIIQIFVLFIVSAWIVLLKRTNYQLLHRTHTIKKNY